MSNNSNTLYRFAEFRFDGEKGKLWRQNDLILLSPKESELLKLLLEYRGKYVSKEEIFEKVWADTFVEDGVLTQNIYKIRKALGNSADGNSLIESKTRMGYRVTAPVYCEDETTERRDNEIARETERGNGTAGNIDAETEQSPHLQPTKTSKSFPFRALVVTLLLALVVGLLAYFYFRPFSRPLIESVKFTRLTNTGNLTNATISPDGSLIAFTRSNALYLKDIATEKEIKIETPMKNPFGPLQFSPDGNSIYFRNNRILSTQSEIKKVSRFGGESQTVIDRSWGSFSVSPDGKKVAYFLNVPPIANFILKVKNLETDEEKEFLIAEPPQNPCNVCAPAWSPDGKKILYITNFPNATGQIFVLDPETGSKQEIKAEKLQRFQQAAWSPDGKSFFVSASDGGSHFQVWKVWYPDGETQPLTMGLSTYERASISADGKRILVLQTNEVSNLYVADGANLENQTQFTTGNNNFGQNGLHWIDEQKILFSMQTEQNLNENLAILNLSDKSQVPITNSKKDAFRVPVSDGRQIWFTRNVGNFSQIFQMDMDGKNVRQLTNATDGQRISPRINNDSKYLFYVLRGKDGAKILRYDLEKQIEEVFFSNSEFQPGPFLELSTDNKYLTFLRMGNRPAQADEKLNAVMTVVSVENKDDIKFFPVSMIPPIRRFAPDSKSLEYILAETEGTQIVRQPFDGGEPKPIYTSPQGIIFNFAWSKDGKRLAIARGDQTRDAVLLSEFDK